MGTMKPYSEDLLVRMIEAMGRPLEAIPARKAKGFFEHCGYRLPVQLL